MNPIYEKITNVFKQSLMLNLKERKKRSTKNNKN